MYLKVLIFFVLRVAAQRKCPPSHTELQKYSLFWDTKFMPPLFLFSCSVGRKKNRDCTHRFLMSLAHLVPSRGMSTWKLPCKGRAVQGGRVAQVTCLLLIMSFMPNWLRSPRKSCSKGHHHWFLSAAAEVNELVLSWFLPINIDVEKKTLIDSSVSEGRAALLEIPSAALQLAAPERRGNDCAWCTMKAEILLLQRVLN